MIKLVSSRFSLAKFAADMALRRLSDSHLEGLVESLRHKHWQVVSRPGWVRIQGLVQSVPTCVLVPVVPADDPYQCEARPSSDSLKIIIAVQREFDYLLLGFKGRQFEFESLSAARSIDRIEQAYSPQGQLLNQEVIEAADSIARLLEPIRDEVLGLSELGTGLAFRRWNEERTRRLTD